MSFAQHPVELAHGMFSIYPIATTIATVWL